MKYRPLFKLDSGGMAEVYVAESEAMAGFTKRVAIKRILPGLLKDEKFVRMFLDEARLSLNLNHANIVSVFDIGKSDNTYFIVMEYVEGTNLKSLIEHYHAHGKRLPVALSIWLLIEVLKGLDYAHNLRDEHTGDPVGIVHRDISPPNILISWNGEVKLTDFGLAKATTQVESTDPGVVKGKFSYLSPEAAHGQDVDLRTDIFAVGILGFEMLTGQRLFVGKTDFETVQKVRAAEVPSISKINDEVPSEVEEILRKALAKDPDTRYATSSAFADDLVGALFTHRMRVSDRDLKQVLAEYRATRREQSGAKIKVDGGADLIMGLLADEMTSFRSIDDVAEDSLIDGAKPLDTLMGGELPSIDDLTSGDTVLPRTASITTPDANKSGPQRSPAPKAEGGGAGKAVVALLLLALLAGAGWFFVLGPGKEML